MKFETTLKIIKKLFNKEDKNYKHNNNNNKYIYLIKRKNVKTIKDLVLEASKYFGDKTFLRYQNKSEIVNVSFKEVLSICEAFSTWLNNKNINENSKKIHVGILGDKSFHDIIIYISTIFSGNVVIPLDPNLDLETSSYCINHSDIDILFYDTKYKEKVEMLKEKCPNVKQYILINENDENDKNLNNDENSLNNILNKYNGQKCIINIKSNDNAFIIYTSGTTGNKKGVVLTHENLVEAAYATFDYLEKDNEIYLNLLPFHHAYSFYNFLLSLRLGYMICLNNGTSELIHDLQLYQPTSVRMVPLMLKNTLNYYKMMKNEHPELSSEDIKFKVFGKNLYRIHTSGSYLSPKIAEEFFNLNIKISQEYGLSETTCSVTNTKFNPKKYSTLGTPISNFKIRIKDDEIQVKSKSIMKEYYKDPERTKEAFTDDGWFKTGDLGYFDEENYIHFTGRKKNLIILENGENISPEILEDLFKSESFIQEIVVYDEDGILCAGVFPNFIYSKSMNIENENIKEKIWEIIESKNKQLPNYEKIKKLTIREIPFVKTASSKIIRNKFLEELKMRKINNNENNNPSKLLLSSNDIQKKLYDITSTIIGNDKFGIDSDLNEYGLDSINCSILNYKLNKEFDISISLTDIIKNSSIIKLEHLI